MKAILKPIVIGTCFLALMCLADAPLAPRGLGFLPQANAGLIVAPVRRTAIVTTAVVASSSAHAAAAANANAAAAATKPPPAAPAGPLPTGTIVTTLPAGCAPTVLNNVEYHRCGSTYYRAQMQGNNLVFVVAQP